MFLSMMWVMSALARTGRLPTTMRLHFSDNPVTRPDGRLIRQQTASGKRSLDGT
jgi:hypothetical protein